MCLVLIAVDMIPGRPRLLLGNRDEFHARATDGAAHWPEHPPILGGRDRVANGSWLALCPPGRMATVTNVRMREVQPAPRSRGALVADFLRSTLGPVEWLKTLRRHVSDYAPFNLLVADRSEVACLQSPTATISVLPRGVHLISNGALDKDWPKMRRLRQAFEAQIARPDWTDTALLDLLGDRGVAADAILPDTGISTELEQFLAPIFIKGTSYGTRASSLACVHDDGSLSLRERSYLPDGISAGELCLSFSGS